MHFEQCGKVGGECKIERAETNKRGNVVSVDETIPFTEANCRCEHEQYTDNSPLQLPLMTTGCDPSSKHKFHLGFTGMIHTRLATLSPFIRLGTAMDIPVYLVWGRHVPEPSGEHQQLPSQAMQVAQLKLRSFTAVPEQHSTLYFILSGEISTARDVAAESPASLVSVTSHER